MSDFGPMWGGVRGGIWGSVGPKIVTFLGAIFVFEILKFWIVWAFWYVEVIKWIFSKSPLQIAQKCSENRFSGHIRGGKFLVPLSNDKIFMMAKTDFWPVPTS